jgi:hypothetical protein
MDNLFDKLFEISDTADSLDKFLNENMQSVTDFYNSDYSNIVGCKNSIERFILFKHSIVSQLDYTKSYSKAFISILLDFCERFNYISATPHVYSIINTNTIEINNRLQAALLFLYPKPTTNSALVEKFELICKKIQISVETEEDNDSKPVATFLNYYGIIINDTRLQFAEEVKTKIITSLENNDYPFLTSTHISAALAIELQNAEKAYIEIQHIIDKVLDKKTVAFTPQFIETYLDKVDKFNFEDTLLIEKDTDYTKKLANISADFDSIRSISISQSDGKMNTNRGVKILETEDELFAYMRRFGNMHKAKLQSALEALPETFPSKVNIIDWGCGQGFASMIFLEKYGNDDINHITLIEPSEIALKRAALHCKKYCSEISLKTICKKLDDLEDEDFDVSESDITIHLFSNILDIDDYLQSHLIQLIEVTQSSQNYFVCVSPYIDAIKTERLESFKRHFETKHDSFNLLLDIATSKESEDYWNCNNHHRGMTCSHHPQCGCQNQWTRIIKVFEVVF